MSGELSERTGESSSWRELCSFCLLSILRKSDKKVGQADIWCVRFSWASGHSYFDKCPWSNCISVNLQIWITSHPAQLLCKNGTNIWGFLQYGQFNKDEKLVSAVRMFYDIDFCYILISVNIKFHTWLALYRMIENNLQIEMYWCHLLRLPEYHLTFFKRVLRSQVDLTLVCHPEFALIMSPLGRKIKITKK